MAVRRELRPYESAQELPPGHVHHAHRREVGEQRERQPLQQRNIPRVLQEHLPGRADDPETDHVHPGARAGSNSRLASAIPQVRADVERVGNEQQRNDAVQQPSRVVPTKVSGDAVPGRAPQAR
jgi:hypothetical protein